MRQVPTALAAHFSSDVITPAHLLTITLNNGVDISLTDHDADITYQGKRYRSDISFDMSAIKSAIDFSVDNADINMAIDGTVIRKADLLGDQYKGAGFEILVCNWQSIADGVLPLKAGTIGEVEIVDEFFVKLTFRGLMGKLQRTVLDVYSPTCRASFGDAKCGFTATPNRVRLENKKYITSDFFLVPKASATVEPVLLNMSFEADGIVANSNTGISGGWVYGDGSYWRTDNTITAVNGSYYLVAGSESVTPSTGVAMRLSRTFTTSSIGMSSVNVDAGTYSVMFSANMMNLSTDRNVSQLRLVFMNSQGTTIGAYKTGLTVKDYQDWNAEHIVQFVPPLTRSIRIELVGYKSQGAEAGCAFDDLKFKYWTNESATFDNVMYRVARIPSGGTAEQLILPNNTFDYNGAVSNSNTGISQWTQDGFFRTVNSYMSLVQPASKYFLLGGDDASGVQKTYSLYQTKTLTNRASSIDDLKVQARIEVEGAFPTAGVTGKVNFIFYTSAGVTISTVDVPLSFGTGWTTFENNSTVVPANARSVRVTLSLTSPIGSSVADGAINEINITMFDTSMPSIDDDEEGTVSSTLPTFNLTLDALTTDGNLILQTRPLPFLYGSVDTAVNQRSIIVLSISGFSAAEMFNGRVTWLSGANAGRTSIIRKYDVATNTVTFYNALIDPITAGDKCVISRGCDKTITTCRALANNFNFRGEPYLPGPNKVIQYLVTGDA